MVQRKLLKEFQKCDTRWNGSPVPFILNISSDPDCSIEDIIAEREIPMHSYSVHLSYPCREIEYN